jgi:hypothetical protein
MSEFETAEVVTLIGEKRGATLGAFEKRRPFRRFSKLGGKALDGGVLARASTAFPRSVTVNRPPLPNAVVEEGGPGEEEKTDRPSPGTRQDRRS